jgi:magnesium-transporting ATPase (P-type)
VPTRDHVRNRHTMFVRNSNKCLARSDTRRFHRGAARKHNTRRSRRSRSRHHRVHRRIQGSRTANRSILGLRKHTGSTKTKKMRMTTNKITNNASKLQERQNQKENVFVVLSLLLFVFSIQIHWFFLRGEGREGKGRRIWLLTTHSESEIC